MGCEKCSGNCASCGGCGASLELTQGELDILQSLGQYSFLPVARKADDMTPRYLEEQSGYVFLLTSWLAASCSWDKLMYGTDWPIVNLGEYIAFIQQLVPERYWEQVFFKNANRIYGLGL